MSVPRIPRTIIAKITIVSVITLLILSAFPVIGQENEGDALPYMMPPDAIKALIDAPQTPSLSLSPDRTMMLYLEQPGLPGIDEVSQPELRIAGLRINPRNSGPSRGRYYNGLTLKNLESGDETKITGIPENPKISSVDWSIDGKYVSFALTMPDHIELWLANVNTAMAKRLTDLSLNDTYGNAIHWLSDSKSIIALTVPGDRGEKPADQLVPQGPVVQENLGRVAPARTYQDLLQNAHDEALFDYYVTSQIVRISLDGNVTPLGEPSIVRSVSPSPDGNYLLVERIHRPYSYTVPVSRFPKLVQVWDTDGNIVYDVVDQPLADNIPITFGSVQTGRRSIDWRADADATLYWAEALDGGDAGAEAEKRDQVFMLPAPFTGEPITLATLTQRYGGITWGSDDLAMIEEWWWPTRNMKFWFIKPGDPTAEPSLWQDRSWEDRYNDPGSPMMTLTDHGQYVMLTADGGNTLFLSGAGASPEGDRPFLDEYNISTGETNRLFRSEAPYYEYAVVFTDVANRQLMTRRESVDQPPNFFIRDLNTGDLTQLTAFPHPTPQLAKVQKELIKYERADGVQLTATLYLPAGYDAEKDGPLPMLMWAYPEEFKSADAAGQVTSSPYRFIRTAWYSPLMFIVDGYAVLDDPSMPIIGEGDEEPNDSYVEQLVADAQAAVDEVVRRGVADRDKIAIGGHSYGAFMVANLLAHSDLFRLGIARSGAYNRTLTPFGFQSEERTLWQAPEVYFAMSPFMHAEKIDEPILLIHGEADNNPGTFPLQSERLYGALKGLGKTARLVMLPSESHSYRARESIMHMLWEMSTWMDRYVKNAEPRPATTEVEVGAVSE